MDTRKPYPSDLSDLQWDNIEHLFPPERRPTGRPRDYPIREVVNAVLYICRTGCAWRLLPHDLPPWGLVSYYFYTWRAKGLWDRSTPPCAGRPHRRRPRADALRQGDRQPDGSRRPRPADPRGTTRGKKIGGRKRHLPVDTPGLIWGLVVLPADVQDRDGAKALLGRVRLAAAAGGDLGGRGVRRRSGIGSGSRWAGGAHGTVLRPLGVKGYVHLPRRWIVERTFGWFGRYRRPSKDYEHNPLSSEDAWIYIAMIHRLSRCRLHPGGKKGDAADTERRKRKLKILDAL